MAARATANGRRDALRDRGMGHLVRDLSGLVSRLVKQEVELAKAELTEKGKKGAAAAGLLGGAAVAALMMLGSLTAVVILALALALPAWAAALIATCIWSLVAGALALAGRDRMRDMGSPVPRKTIDTVKEDVQWLRDRT